MIGNCDGCKYEWSIMCDYVKEGHHVATTKDWDMSYPLNRGKHYAMFIVDDDGKIIIS